MPLKPLSLEELASRHECDLCFNYDEKFHRDHKCASRVFLIIVDDDDDTKEDSHHINPPDPPVAHDLDQAQISYHSLLGHLALETLRLLGSANNHQVVILVDGGSTHNFVQESLASQLGLVSRVTTHFRVMVDNGQYLQCHFLCEVVPVQVQGIIFLVDIHLLSLHGANLVLGVQGLKSLGHVLIDYNALSMQFFHDDHLVELKGEVDSTLQMLTPPQLHHIIHTKDVNAYFHISITPTELPLTQTSSTQILLEI